MNSTPHLSIQKISAQSKFAPKKTYNHLKAQSTQTAPSLSFIPLVQLPTTFPIHSGSSCARISERDPPLSRVLEAFK